MAVAKFTCEISNMFHKEAMLMCLNWDKVQLSISFMILWKFIEQNSGSISFKDLLLVGHGEFGL